MTSKKLAISDQNGMGMLTMLMAAATLGLLIYFMGDLQLQRNRNIYWNRLTMNRDNLADLLSYYASDLKVLQLSASYAGSNSAGNVTFAYCLNGSPATGPSCAPNCCVDTTASPQPFQIVDPLNPVSILVGTDPSPKGAPAATSFVPANFDVTGSPCAPGGASCPLEAVATYVAACGGGSSSCRKAVQLTVNVTLRLATDGQGNILAALGHTGILKPKTSVSLIR